jgi:thiamine phosphate synthase YjbQ (UPF0047 family)
MRTPKEQALRNALLTVQMLGSAGAITTIEYESGALSDLRHALDLLAPVRGEYTHSARWGDGNGFSHVRSALLKTRRMTPLVSQRRQTIGSLGLWSRDRC